MMIIDIICNYSKIKFMLEDLKYRDKKRQTPTFGVGDKVRKVTGDYHIDGTVASSFSWEGKIRYVVAHKAEGGGSFLHIYSQSNLEGR